MRQPHLSRHGVKWVLWGILLAAALGLAACGDDSDKSPPPNFVITIQPQPEATILPGCDTRELESWFEVSSTTIRQFQHDSETAMVMQPPEMTSMLNRLLTLRDTIAGQPTPECAIDVHSAILIQMRGMLVGFQRYANGDLTQEQIMDQITRANEQIDAEIATALEVTRSDLEQRLRDERQTTTPPADGAQ